MQNALQQASAKKTFRTGLHSDTGYPVETPNLLLTLTNLNKKGNYYFFCEIQVLIESRSRQPCFSESAVADLH